jgi:hypothetical protein
MKKTTQSRFDHRASSTNSFPVRGCRMVIAYLFLSILAGTLHGQVRNDTIDEAETKRLLTWLADDARKGRVNYTVEQVQAAAFIADYFRQCGLRPFSREQGYVHAFSTEDRPPPNPVQVFDLLWNGRRLKPHQYFSNEELPIDREDVLSSFTLVRVDNPQTVDSLESFISADRPLLLWWPMASSLDGLDIDTLRALAMLNPQPILMVADPRAPTRVRLLGNRDYIGSVLHNVVAVLPGRSRKDEAVIFSAHYDHVSKDVRNNSLGLFNGANDNASGVTAVLQLARYYAMRGPQERTLIFVCFAGEEIGLLGSRMMAEKIVPEKIAAVINMEMIGQHQSAGKDAFFVTGHHKSNLKQILAENLAGTGFHVLPDPGSGKSLFERSDNLPFFEKGIVAHTLMCSDDTDPCYHRPCDDAKRVDVANMTGVIRAIARSVEPIVQGLATPRLKR